MSIRNPASRFDNLRGGSRIRLASYKRKAAERAASPRILPQYRAEYLAPGGWKKQRWITPHGLGFAAPYDSVSRSRWHGCDVMHMDTGALDHLRAPSRDELTNSDAHALRGEPRGWYADADCCETITAYVAKLPAREGEPRFIGWIKWSDADGITALAETFADADDAWRAADPLAERVAEEGRKYNERWQKASRASDKRDDARGELKDCAHAARDILRAWRELKEQAPMSGHARGILATDLSEMRDAMRDAIAKIHAASEEIDSLGMSGEF
jgi:hypothetical protein